MTQLSKRRPLDPGVPIWGSKGRDAEHCLPRQNSKAPPLKPGTLSKDSSTWNQRRGIQGRYPKPGLQIQKFKNTKSGLPNYFSNANPGIQDQEPRARNPQQAIPRHRASTNIRQPRISAHSSDFHQPAFVQHSNRCFGDRTPYIGAVSSKLK